MTTDPRHIAADLLAAMTDDEAAEFVANVRNTPADPMRLYVAALFADHDDDGTDLAKLFTIDKEN